MQNKGKWEVGSQGGDDILKQFIVSRAVNPKTSAREFILNGSLVKIFDERTKAQTKADRLNRQEQRVQALLKAN